MKKCRTCSQTKPFDNFSRCSRQGYQSKCKSCKSAYYQVRGLLCDKCNRGLGFLEDSIETLKKAIKYLEDSNAIQRERDRDICMEK